MATKKETDQIKALTEAINALVQAQSLNNGISPQLEEDIRSIKQDMTNTVLPAVKKINDDYFVKKADFTDFKTKEFDPVDLRTRDTPTIKFIVYGMVAVILTTVFGALLALVIFRPGA